MENETKEKQEKPNNIVAYIDLLAFSNHLIGNTTEALMIMNNYNTILSQKIIDDKLYPPKSYCTELQYLAKNKSIDSFDYFLPFSDSVFLMSNDCSSFIKQLGNFVLESFLLTSRFYEAPKNPANPEKGESLNFSIDSNQELKVETGSCDYYPTLFRGGLAYGESFPIELKSIIGKAPSMSKVITGKAVVEAVKLESVVKGPRLVFPNNVYKELDDDAKDYCRELPEDNKLYEILWPAMIYINQNNEFENENEFNKFNELIVPVYNLWKAYKDTQYSIHYFKFIELIIASTIQFFDKKCNMRNKAVEKIKHWINSDEIKDKIALKNIDLNKY